MPFCGSLARHGQTHSCSNNRHARVTLAAAASPPSQEFSAVRFKGPLKSESYSRSGQTRSKTNSSQRS